MKKVLIICKERHLPNYGTVPGYTISSGLLNSASFVNDMLNNTGITSKVVEVVDNNSIDKEVSIFNPDIVVIEALWVVPEKFDILAKLHPWVTWVIRIHSEVPFISNEGNAIDWIVRYTANPNVRISVNSERMKHDLSVVINDDIVYLPNYYPIKSVDYSKNPKSESINIGCFGAIRPLKNHLIQAMAAIQFADDSHKKLKFHINVNRIEGNAAPILKNLRALFAGRPEHELVEHYWKGHGEFVDLVKTMDIGMQVSFSETFNIVAADFVANGKPIVVSKEISWASKFAKVMPTSKKSIVCGLKRVWFLRHFRAQALNTYGLGRSNNIAVHAWLTFLDTCD